MKNQKPKFKCVCFKCGHEHNNPKDVERCNQAGYFVCKAKNFCK